MGVLGFKLAVEAELAAGDPMTGPSLGDNAISQDDAHSGALRFWANGSQGGGNGRVVELVNEVGQVRSALVQKMLALAT